METKKKKLGKIVLLTIIVLLLIVVIILGLDPLRRRTPMIRLNLLRSITVGSSMDDVMEYINKEKWQISYIEPNCGYLVVNGDPSDGIPSYREKNVGEKYIKVRLGGYRNITAVDVIAYFGFDETDRLVNIHVTKEINSL